MEVGAGHHVFRDSRLADVDPEFQQFAMNPRRAPTGIRLGHGANQSAEVGGHRRPTDASAAPPCPLEPEASSVPGDYGLRLDDDERRSPFRQHTREHDPEPTVRLRELQPPRPGALQYLQLVPQSQHLELKRSARMCPCTEGQEE